MALAAPWQEQVGPFRLLRPLGEGGSGRVWLADRVYVVEGTEQTRTVAVKEAIIRADEATEQNEANLRREFLVGANIQHPNVCAVRDCVRVEQRLLVEMEYIDGLNALEVLRRLQGQGLRLPASAAVELVLQASAGLHAIHTAADRDGPMGLVHRDIKPENLMVSWRGEVKVLDLGITRGHVPRSQHTQAAYVRGTPPYMAPEQHSGGTLGPPADLFALGAALHELLTGEVLFPEPVEGGELLDAKRRGVGLERLQAHPDLPGPLAEVIARCVQPRPEQRYARASELEGALRAQLAALGPSPGLRGLMSLLRGQPLLADGAALDDEWRALERLLCNPRRPVGLKTTLRLLYEEERQRRPAPPPPQPDARVLRPQRTLDPDPPKVEARVLRPQRTLDPDPPPPRSEVRAPAPAVAPQRDRARKQEAQGPVAQRPRQTVPQDPVSDPQRTRPPVDVPRGRGSPPQSLPSGAPLPPPGVQSLPKADLRHPTLPPPGRGADKPPESQPRRQKAPPVGPRSRRRGWPWAAAVLLVLVGSGLVWWGLGGGQPPAAPVVPCYADRDGDGVGGPPLLEARSEACDAPGESQRTGDCDDANKAVFLGATERLDGVDNDCDGVLAEGEGDADGDGALDALDCAPEDTQRHPAATELAGDGVDQDCDQRELCYEDLDGDGWGGAERLASGLDCGAEGLVARGGDCDDNNRRVHPGAQERAGNELDEDCDGRTDAAPQREVHTRPPPPAPDPAPVVNPPPPTARTPPSLRARPTASLERGGVGKPMTLRVKGGVLDLDRACTQRTLAWWVPDGRENIVLLGADEFSALVPDVGRDVDTVQFSVLCVMDGRKVRLKDPAGANVFTARR